METYHIISLKNDTVENMAIKKLANLWSGNESLKIELENKWMWPTFMIDRIILSFISFLFLHFVYDFEFSFRCYLCINLLVLMSSLDAEIWEL